MCGCAPGRDPLVALAVEEGPDGSFREHACHGRGRSDKSQLVRDDPSSAEAGDWETATPCHGCRATEQSSRPSTDTRLAELHEEGGRTDAAAAALERAIGLDPVHEEAYRRLIAPAARPRAERRGPPDV